MLLGLVIMNLTGLRRVPIRPDYQLACTNLKLSVKLKRFNEQYIIVFFNSLYVTTSCRDVIG